MPPSQQEPHLNLMNYPRTGALTLAVFQLAGGVVIIGIQCYFSIIADYNVGKYAGFWSALYFFVCGCGSIITWKYSKISWVVTQLVLDCIAIPVSVASIICIGISSSDFVYYTNDPNVSSTTDVTLSHLELTLCVVLITFSISEGLLAFIGILFCCFGLFGEKPTNEGIGDYPLLGSSIVALLQLVGGVVLISLQVTCVVFEQNPDVLSDVGFWSGIYFLICGVMSITAWRYNNKRLVIALVILDVLAMMIGLAATVTVAEMHTLGYTTHLQYNNELCTAMMAMAIGEGLLAFLGFLFCCFGLCGSKPQQQDSIPMVNPTEAYGVTSIMN